MTETRQLLADYARDGSEGAFREIVARYLDLVYSAAVRLVDGDAHRAQDVAQTVFLDLARKARTLPADVMLGGWLHRHTCFVASTVMRGERRRQFREREAARMNALEQQDEPSFVHLGPLLDEAINQLGADDRAAILSRFFEQNDFRGVGAAFGGNKDAARMRVNRALEKLQSLLKKRGVIFPVAALGAALAAQSVHAAPAGLAASITATAIAGAASGGSTITLIKVLTMTKIKLGIIGAVLAVGVATPLIMQDRARLRLESENSYLRNQLEQQKTLIARYESAQSNKPDSVSQAAANDQSELMRLRAEVTRLRTAAQESALHETAATHLKPAEAISAADQLRQKLSQMPERSIPELQLLNDKKWAEDAGRAQLDNEESVREALGNLRRAAKMIAANSMSKALENYLQASGGQLPTDISQLKPYFNPPLDDSLWQRYELLHTGKASDFAPGEPLIAEKAPVDDQYDTLFKIRGNGFSMAGVGNWNNQTLTNIWPSSPGGTAQAN